jgi:predicted transcriptional regulator
MHTFSISVQFDPRFFLSRAPRAMDLPLVMTNFPHIFSRICLFAPMMRIAFGGAAQSEREITKASTGQIIMHLKDAFIAGEDSLRQKDFVIQRDVFDIVRLFTASVAAIISQWGARSAKVRFATEMCSFTIVVLASGTLSPMGDNRKARTYFLLGDLCMAWIGKSASLPLQGEAKITCNCIEAKDDDYCKQRLKSLVSSLNDTEAEVYVTDVHWPKNIERPSTLRFRDLPLYLDGKVQAVTYSNHKESLFLSLSVNSGNHLIIPKVALIVQEPWATLLVEGVKSLELRKSMTLKRGLVGVIASKSGCLIGTVEITDAQSMDLDEVTKQLKRHGVPDVWVQSYCKKRKHLCGWSVSGARRFNKPIPIEQKQGSVIWVNL